ncbi:hypothetical protein D3C72_1813000 [compost metagenome]
MQVGVLAAQAARLLKRLLVGEHQRHALVALALQGLKHARVLGGIGGAGGILLRPHFLGAQRHGRLQALLGKAHDAAMNGRRDEKADDDRRQEAQGKEEREFNHELAVSKLDRKQTPRRTMTVRARRFMLLPCTKHDVSCAASIEAGFRQGGPAIYSAARLIRRVAFLFAACFYP